MNGLGDTERRQFAALYESAFPPEERRPTADELALDDKRFTISLIEHQGKFAGFITVWHFDRFTYIEHFATLPELRGGGIGSQTLATLLASTDKPVVLEVEPPAGTIAKRRIAFYRRAGFAEMPQPYEQPPYRAGAPAVPLRIMTTSRDTGDDFFDEIKRTLYSEVYKITAK